MHARVLRVLSPSPVRGLAIMDFGTSPEKVVHSQMCRQYGCPVPNSLHVYSGRDPRDFRRSMARNRDVPALAVVVAGADHHMSA